RELARGQAVTLRGRFLADAKQLPTLGSAYLVEVGKDPSVAVTAVELTKAFAADKDATVKKYVNQPLRVEGVVAEVMKSGDGYVVSLAGFDEGKAGKPHRVGTYLFDDGSKRWAAQL